MSELPHYPFVNQLASTTLDGRYDENRGMNCVPSSISSALDYLIGKKFYPDQLKDAVYGESYQGGTAAVSYVTFCARQGVRLFPIAGNPAYLVAQIHEHIGQGHPVIGTIPAPYNPPRDRFNPGMSHVIAFYSERPGVITAMNPWRAFSQPETDQWWMDRLCFGQIWVLEKKGNTSVDVPQGWQRINNVLYAPNKIAVKLGFMQYVLAHNWHPDDYPLEPEHGDASGTAQLFRSRELRWSPKAGVQEIYLGDALYTYRHAPPPAPVTPPVEKIPDDVNAAIKSFSGALMSFAQATSEYLKVVK